MLRSAAVVAFVVTSSVAAFANAQTRVDDAWVRATVPQQHASGLFANVTSTNGGRLVSASSPVAKTIEIHEMRMDGDVMRMRAVTGVDLPPGKPVALAPGGYHVMMLGLDRQLKAGETVPVTLVVQHPGGADERIVVQAPVRALSDAAPMPMH